MNCASVIGNWVMHASKVRLLIVDDEASIRASLTQMFMSRGHYVRSSADASSAFDEIRAELPDVLLSDLNMPGMSGFELLSKVRRHFPAVQVIAMSAAYLGEDVPPGVAADAFYAKGRSSPEVLLELVEAMTRPPQGVHAVRASERSQ